MTETDTVEQHDDNGDEPSPFRIALGFFILPLILVIGGIGVFLVFGVLAHDGADPASYLPEINGRGINEPWQAAFHLSQQLQYNDELKGDAEFTAEVIRALEKADGDDDPRIRRFLTIALGRLEHASAVPVLVEHTADSDPEVRVNSLWALGTIGDPSAAASVAERLRDDETEVRTMAAYVLGALAQPETSPALQVALNDPVPTVRWNAAVALGMMGDTAGLETLGRMIDRTYLASVPGVTEQGQSDTMLAALTALERIGGAGFQTELAALRDSDPDLRVREAARRALQAAEASVTGDSEPLLAQGQ